MHENNSFTEEKIVFLAKAVQEYSMNKYAAGSTMPAIWKHQQMAWEVWQLLDQLYLEKAGKRLVRQTKEIAYEHAQSTED